MNAIIRKVDDWIHLFETFEEARRKYGSDVILETKLILERIKEHKLTQIGNHAVIFDALCDCSIDDVNTATHFLNAIQNYYSFKSLLKQIRLYQIRYGIDSIAFFNQNDKKVIDFYFNFHGYRKVYYCQNEIPFIQVDLESNNLFQAVFNENYPFIVDEKDFVNHNNNRTLYTTFFQFNTETLPLKEQMDMISCEKEIDNLFSLILSSINVYQADLSINVDNPNGEYSYPEFYCDEKMTIHTDGILFNQYGDELNPSKCGYNTSSLKVMNAKYVLIVKFIDSKVEEINLTIHPRYLEQIMNSDNEVVKEYLNSLLSGEARKMELK